MQQSPKGSDANTPNTSCSNLCALVPQDAERSQAEVLVMYRTLLMVVIFGSLSPLLFLVVPCFALATLSAINWITQLRCLDCKCATAELHTNLISKFLARKLLVQHPTMLISLLAVVGQWGVTAVMFYDLEFKLGPIVFYIVFATLGMVSVLYCGSPFFRRASGLQCRSAISTHQSWTEQHIKPKPINSR